MPVFIEQEEKEESLKELLKEFEYCKENNKVIEIGSYKISLILDYIEYLYKWIKEEQDKNNKTIQYISDSLNNPMCYEMEALKNCKKILKGDDKN